MILKEDFEKIFQHMGSELTVLKNKKILVTGANGMIGGYLCRFLKYLNEKSFNITVDGVVRNPDLKEHLFHPIIGDVNDVNYPSSDYHYIVHAASLASPVHYAANPIGTSLPNILGTVRLLELAEKCPLESFLFISSSEVYGSFSVEKDFIKETDFGFLDPMNPRSCYAESKRMGENLCVSWFNQNQVPVKILRPFHTYGPGLKSNDGRVYADFIYNIIDGKNIVMNSAGDAKRAFCYLGDALEGLLKVLIKGKNAEAYNVGNPEQEYSILELAQKCVEIHPSKKLKVIQNISSNNCYLKSQVLRNNPSIEKLRTLGWNPSVEIQEGLRRTIKYIEEGSHEH
jgi:UDP-glucuronate decarboxylase